MSHLLFGQKNPKTAIVICTTQIWSRICKLQDFFKVCWQWGSSFCLIFKLFITCQPKKCVTELKVIWNEVIYKNSDSTATLLTNDSLIEGCLWVSSDKQGHRLIAFRIKQQWYRFERFVQKIVYQGPNMPCLTCT